MSLRWGGLSSCQQAVFEPVVSYASTLPWSVVPMVLLPACGGVNMPPEASIDRQLHEAAFGTADSMDSAGASTDPEGSDLSGSSLAWTLS